MGEIRNPGSEGFVTYFLVLGLIKSPLPTIAVLAFAGLLLVSRRNEIRSPQILTLVAAVLVFAIYFSLLFRAQIGLRHFLVVFPPLFVLAGIAGRELSASVAGRAGAVALIALAAVSVIRHGDDPLSYFNELVDPTRTYLYAADSNIDWGQSKRRIESYLVANPDVITAPAKPFPGRILVGVNQLTGMVTRKRMEWLRESDLKPVSHVAYTHFLFVVSLEEAARMRARRGEPPLPPS